LNKCTSVLKCLLEHQKKQEHERIFYLLYAILEIDKIIHGICDYTNSRFRVYLPLVHTDDLAFLSSYGVTKLNYKDKEAIAKLIGDVTKQRQEVEDAKKAEEQKLAEEKRNLEEKLNSSMQSVATSKAGFFISLPTAETICSPDIIDDYSGIKYMLYRCLGDFAKAKKNLVLSWLSRSMKLCGLSLRRMKRVNLRHRLVKRMNWRVCNICFTAV